MELMTMSNLQPDRFVENYRSLIWAERYAKAGDFELVSDNVFETINLLPLETMVCLRESTVPMVVEMHKITKPLRGAPTLSVIGRSFETVLDRRAATNTLPPDIGRIPWTIQAEKEADAAYQAMRIVLGDIERSQEGNVVLSEVSPAVSPLDAIPEIDLILPADYNAGTTNSYEIKAQDLYVTVMELISTNHRGLKAVRPTPTGTKIGIEIYNGADLTEFVQIDARFDQFDNATYLLSKAGSKNLAYVYGPTGSEQILKTQAPEPSGLERRVLIVDQSSDTTASLPDVRRTRALVELYKQNHTALFDGEIAQKIAARYNVDYHLGDIIKLVGEYGLSQNVRVAEFIRSSDSSGVKAFPTFEAID